MIQSLFLFYVSFFMILSDIINTSLTVVQLFYFITYKIYSVIVCLFGTRDEKHLWYLSATVVSSMFMLLLTAASTVMTWQNIVSCRSWVVVPRDKTLGGRGGSREWWERSVSGRSGEETSDLSPLSIYIKRRWTILYEQDIPRRQRLVSHDFSM
jgi:hypothetical protein